MNQPGPSTKKWNTEQYDGKHSFVWKYGEEVIELLAPQPGERILDLGCGTGHLADRIAASGAQVVGVDSSASMIESARRNYPATEFIEADATALDFEARFDAVFSNATIHWIKDQNRLARVVRRALRPGGRFVAEFGGKGNLNAVREALKLAVAETGHEANDDAFARYYPSIGAYATLLESAGLRVTYAAHFERPTKLENGEQGLRNWLATFADNVIEKLSADERERVFVAVEGRLRGELFRDGSWFADYRRIRIAALKPDADLRELR